MTRMISIAIICGAAALTGAAPSAPSQTTSQAEYHYALPLNLAVEAATEAVRVCALTRISSERNSRGHGWGAAGRPSR